MDIARIEIIERDVLADLFAAAPAELATAYGIAARRLNDGLLMINRRLDSIMFNRIMALGVLEPVRAETLDEGLAAFEAAGIRNWCVQVAPGTGSLGAMLTERGWSPRPRLWAKFAYPDGGPESFPTALDIREIGQADALAFGAVVAEAFGLPRETAGWIAALVGQPRWKVYAAFDGPVLVAGGGALHRWPNLMAWVWCDKTRVPRSGGPGRPARHPDQGRARSRLRPDHDRDRRAAPGRTGPVLQKHPAGGV
jgi:hypothetical protein